MVFLIFVASMVALEAILHVDRRRSARKPSQPEVASEPTNAEALAALMSALAADAPDRKFSPDETTVLKVSKERYNIR